MKSIFNKHKMIFIQIILVTSLLLFLGNADNISLNDQSKATNTPLLTKAQYVEHGPIDVRNDTALASFASSGSGTSGSPYIIENLNITAGETNGIFILGTAVHFEIRNCWISVGFTGIYAGSPTGGTAKIYNNTLVDCSTGIRVSMFNSIEVYNNTCEADDRIGLYISRCDFAVVTDNVLLNTKLVLDYSDSIQVNDNKITDSGFSFDYGSSVDLTSITLSGNTVNDLPIGLIKNQNGGTISGTYGQIVLAACTSVTVENQVISNTEIGIALYFSTHCVIQNNVLENNTYGIFVEDGDRNIIQSNNCTRNKNYGIYGAEETNYMLIRDNIVSYSSTGIDIHYSNHGYIENNTVAYCKNYGIQTYGFDPAVNMTIIGNVVHHIRTSTYNYGNGIVIGGSTNYGYIIDNIAYNCSNNGIASNADNGVIHNNTCYWNDQEAIDFSGDYTEATNNTCYENRVGIKSNNARWFTIKYSKCYNNINEGINVKGTEDNATVAYNHVYNNGATGLQVQYQPYCNISHNTINNDNLKVTRSENSRITNNSITNGGLIIQQYNVVDYLSYTVEDNAVNTLPIAYVENVIADTITGAYGQIILINCSSITVSAVTIQNTGYGIACYYSSNCVFDAVVCNNNEVGLYIYETDVVEISNSDFTSSENGISIDRSNNVEIISCSALNNKYYGIHLSDVSNCTVNDSDLIENLYHGLRVFSCDNVIIKNTRINFNGRSGIDFYSSQDCTAMFNTIEQNEIDGIAMSFSDSIDIWNNSIYKNHLNGLYIYYSSYINAYWNLFATNNAMGVNITTQSSNYCQIQHNYFAFNNLINNSQAFDEGVNNTWYRNTWSNDISGNYSIAGSAKSFDNTSNAIWSLSVYQPSISTAISNIEITEGDTGEVVSWTVTDPEGETIDYVVYLDGVQEQTGTLNSGESVVASLDDLTVGNYNYTIVITDTTGIVVTHSVAVTVESLPVSSSSSSPSTSSSSSSEEESSESSTPKQGIYPLLPALLSMVMIFLFKKRSQEK